MTSEEKGENGIFWEQMEELEPTKGAWNFPKGLKNPLNKTFHGRQDFHQQQKK
jgi:hypothetical protein